MKHLSYLLVSFWLTLTPSFIYAEDNTIIPILQLLLLDEPPAAIYSCEVGKIYEINQPSGGYSTEANFVDLGNLTLFIAESVNAGIELWRTDGTQSGTSLLKDINLGADDGFGFAALDDQPQLVKAGNKIFFSADSGSSSGDELWVSNGTTNGTIKLKSFTVSSINNIVAYNNKIYFMVNENENGSVEGGLWESNGTVTGTKRLKAGATLQGPHTLEVLGGNLIFTLGVTSRTLWKYNISSNASTSLQSFSGFLTPEQFAKVGNKIFFLFESSNIDQLWVTDGTIVGTRFVKNVDTDTTFGAAINIDGSQGYTVNSGLNGKLYFIGYDASHGAELWVSDGTSGGTHIVEDIKPGTSSSLSGGSLAFDNAITFNNHFYFTANKQSNGPALFKLGSNDNISHVTDVEPYHASDVPAIVANERFLFYTHQFDIFTNNRELVIVDKQNTTRTIDVFPGDESSTPAYFHVRSDQSVLFITRGDAALYKVSCPS